MTLKKIISTSSSQRSSTVERSSSVDDPFQPTSKLDLRDLWLHYQNAQTVYDYVHNRLVDVDLEAPLGPEVEPILCQSYEELLTGFRENGVHLSQKMEDAIAVGFAVMVSVRIKGPLLWVYMIGGSGIGKSLLCETLGADIIHAKMLDEMRGLTSGYKAPDGKDTSLLPQLLNKCLIVQEFTNILALSDSQQEKIFGQMRSAYGGRARAHFLNDKELFYDKINFSTIAGVTNEIHGLRQSALGERFLKVDIDEHSARDAILDTSIQNVAMTVADSMADTSTLEGQTDQLANMPILKQYALGFNQHLFSKLAAGVSIQYSSWFLQRIKALAGIVAVARANVRRQSGPDRDLLYRPVLEVGSHVGGQLTKLAGTLSVVLDRPLDEEVYRIVRKVALDTAYGFTLDVIRALGDMPKEWQQQGGMILSTLSRRADIPETSLRKILQDLLALDVVEVKRAETPSGVSGRCPDVWNLTERVRELWETIFPPRAKTRFKKPPR